MSYPDNVVFLGGKFAQGQVVAIALVAPGLYAGSGKRLRPGSELYLEIAPGDAPGGRAEKQDIYGPGGEMVSRSAAAAAITEFMGEDTPYVVTEATRLEWTAVCNLFGLQRLPFDPEPIELVDVLMSAGLDPRTDRHALASKFNIDSRAFDRHHPLDGARLLSDLYTAVRGWMRRNASGHKYGS